MTDPATISCHGLAIVRWLSETVGNDEESKSLIDSLSSVFNVQVDSLDDFLNFDYAESLRSILAAGIEKRNAGLYDSDLLDAKQHKKFCVVPVGLAKFPKRAAHGINASGSHIH